MANNSQPPGLQFRPVIQSQQGQPFVPMASQQFGMSVVHSQQLQYSQPMHQLTPRATQPGHPAPSSQPIPMPYIQINRPPVPPHSQQTAPHLSNLMPGLAVLGAPSHSSYTQHDNVNASAQYQPPTQMLAPPVGQPWLSSVSQNASSVTPVQQDGGQLAGSTMLIDPRANAPN